MFIKLGWADFSNSAVQMSLMIARFVSSVNACAPVLSSWRVTVPSHVFNEGGDGFNLVLWRFDPGHHVDVGVRPCRAEALNEYASSPFSAGVFSTMEWASVPASAPMRKLAHMCCPSLSAPWMPIASGTMVGIIGSHTQAHYGSALSRSSFSGQ